MNKEDLKKKLLKEANIKVKKPAFSDKIKQFFSYLSIFLLLGFVISMCVVSLIYILDTDSFVLVKDGFTGELSGHSVSFYENTTFYYWLILLSLLGWMFFSPDFKRGVKKLFKRLE